MLETDLGGGDWKTRGAPRTDRFTLRGLRGRHRLRLWTVDNELGNALHAWRSLGSPDYPKAAQLAALREAAQPVLLRDDTVDLSGDFAIDHELAPCALACWEIERA